MQLLLLLQKLNLQLLLLLFNNVNPQQGIVTVLSCAAGIGNRPNRVAMSDTFRLRFASCRMEGSITITSSSGDGAPHRRHLLLLLVQRGSSGTGGRASTPRRRRVHGASRRGRCGGARQQRPRRHSSARLRPRQALVVVRPLLYRQRVPLIHRPLVDEAGRARLTGAHAALRILFTRQAAGLIVETRQRAQEGEVGQAAERRALRVEIFEAVDGELAATEQALDVRGTVLVVLVQLLVRVQEDLDAGARGLALLGRRFDAWSGGGGGGQP